MPPSSKSAATPKGSGKAAAVTKAGGRPAATIAKAGAKRTNFDFQQFREREDIRALYEREDVKEMLKHAEEFMQKSREPTPIPGWCYFDVLGGTKGCASLGHSIYDMEDPRLKDPKLHERCQAWMPLSLADLKAACKKHKLLVEGTKKVLALRLAIKVPQAEP